jgi:hypothetical protein
MKDKHAMLDGENIKEHGGIHAKLRNGEVGMVMPPMPGGN